MTSPSAQSDCNSGMWLSGKVGGRGIFGYLLKKHACQRGLTDSLNSHIFLIDKHVNKNKKGLVMFFHKSV